MPINEKASLKYGLEDLILLSVLPKTTYKFNIIPTKIPMMFFTKLKNLPTIQMDSQVSLNRQHNLENEEQSRGLTLPDYKIYYNHAAILWYYETD